MRPQEPVRREHPLESGQWGTHGMHPVIGVHQTAAFPGLDEPDRLRRERQPVVAGRDEDARDGESGG